MDTPDIEEVMNTFHSELGSEKLRLLMEEFSAEKNPLELFQLFWDLEESHRCLSPTLSRPRKSDAVAERLRSEGNQFYKQKNLDKALELYNLSIINAPHPELPKVPSSGSVVVRRGNKEMEKGKDVSKEESQSSRNIIKEGDYNALAFGYANRSAVLLEMQLYEKCLEDINQALLHGYPNSSQNKLEDRKQKCCEAKMQNRKFKQSSLPENCKSGQRIILASYKPSKLPELPEPNPSLPSFSSSVNVAFTPDKGRHIIANRDIRPGEVIAIEKSYCSSLDLENMTVYCSNCLTHCLTPIPCPSCSLVVFCSEDCRQQGFWGDHWLECPILPTLNALGLKPVFTMVYKLLKYSSHIKWKTTLEGLQEREKLCPPERLGLNEDGVYSPEDYESIYHLVGNKERRPNGDLYVKCLIAFILMELLKQSERYFVDYFGQPFSPGKEDLLTTGETLLSNLMKVSCNGFQLVEFQCTGPPITLSRTTIGSAIFPTLSLVNHSCDPTATPYIYGRVQVLRATRCISPGEEVTESYCKTFYTEGQEQRQMGLLEVYQFTCNCEACQKNWPTYQELPKEAQFKCVDCSRPVSSEAPLCRNCKLDYSKHDYEASKQLSIDEWWATVKQVGAAFEKSRNLSEKVKLSKPATEEDFLVIQDAVEMMDKHVRCPCQPLWDVYDAMDLYFRVEGAPVFAYLHDHEE